MIEIRKFADKDKEQYFAMSGEFYSSSAVEHKVPKKHFEVSFNLCVSKSPFIKGYMLFYNGVPCGYALFSFTYSNEAGGEVLLIEELFIKEDFRGKGMFGELFEFIKKKYSKKVARFRLEVTGVNKNAIEIYKKYGFRELEYTQMILDT